MKKQKSISSPLFQSAKIEKNCIPIAEKITFQVGFFSTNAVDKFFLFWLSIREPIGTFFAFMGVKKCLNAAESAFL